MRNYYKKLKKGFTLVELVVVIAVIAILAAVSVGAYFGITDSANSSNATTSLKQVKDYWTMYSVSDYDASKTDYETGNDFAARYITYQGYDVAVNFKTVNYTRNTGAQGLAGYDNGNGILFKVETNYPTWILVEDNRIIAESKAPLKNNEEFMASLEEGEYVITTLANWNDFELSTLVDSNGVEVRGVGYVKYVIASDEGVDNDGNFSSKSTLYYRQELSLYEASNGTFNPDSKTGTYEDGSISFAQESLWKMYQTNDGETKPYDTKKPNSISNTIVEAIDNANYLNGFVTTVVELKQDWANVKPVYDETIIDTHPVMLFNGSDYVFYRSLDQMIGNLPVYTGYNEADYSTYRYILCYGDKAVLNEGQTLSVPSGYILGVDFVKYEGISTAQNFITKYVKNIDASTQMNLTKTNGNTANTHKEDTDYVKYNTKYKTFDTDTSDFTSYSETLPEGKSRFTYGLRSTIAKQVNKITINGILSLNENAHVFNEAIVTIPNGTSNGAGILDHGAIYMGEKGSINLSKTSVLRSMGKIYGGAINTTGDATGGSTVLDFFKPYSYLGGSFTTMNVNKKIFPVYNYIFDNINSNVSLVYGAKYKLTCGMSANEKAFFMKPLSLIGPSSSFINLESGASMTIKYENGRINTNLVKGKFSLGSLQLELGGTTIQSKDYKFPLNNINLTIESDAKFTIPSYEYIVMPNSSIINNGIVNITNGAKVGIFNYTAAQFNDFANNDVIVEKSSHQVFSIAQLKYVTCKTTTSNNVLKDTIKYYADCMSVNNRTIENNKTVNIDNKSGLFTMNGIYNAPTASLVNNATNNIGLEYIYMLNETHQSSLCKVLDLLGSIPSYKKSFVLYTESHNVPQN